MLSKESKVNNILLSFDVEDNFSKDELLNPKDWVKYESQVVENTKRVINTLKQINANATFFVVGKVAERHPNIVKMIDTAGFEVASHGFSHAPVTSMTPNEFEADLKKSISIIESITSKSVIGYRARSFSITRDTLWAFQILIDNGIKFDSSLTAMELNHLSKNISTFSEISYKLTLIPVCNIKLLGKKLSVSGGIMLRILFFRLYKSLLACCSRDMNYQILYAHVWEFNKDQPKRNVNLFQKIAQSPFTYTTKSKISKLASTNNFISLSDHLKNNNI